MFNGVQAICFLLDIIDVSTEMLTSLVVIVFFRFFPIKRISASEVYGTILIAGCMTQKAHFWVTVNESLFSIPVAVAKKE